MLAHVVEEGRADSPEAELLARHYLANRPEIDTLILGCAHLPVAAGGDRTGGGSGCDAGGQRGGDSGGGQQNVSAAAAVLPAGTRCALRVGDPAAFVHAAKSIAVVEQVLRLPCPVGRGHGEAVEKPAS